MKTTLSKIKKALPVLFFAFLVFLPPAANAQEQAALDFNLKYENNKVEIVSVTTRQTPASQRQEPTTNIFTLKILDNKNNVLSQTKFSFEQDVIGETFDVSGTISGTPQRLTIKNLLVSTPYFENANNAQITDSSNNIVTQKDIKQALKQSGKTQNGQKPIPYPNLLVIVIALTLLAFIIYKKSHMDTSVPSSKIAMLIKNKALFLAVVAILLAIITLTIIAILKNQQKLSDNNPPQASPSPSPVALPSTDERLKLLKLMPQVKDGKYIFEYEPQAQFFFLIIENQAIDKEIRQEIVNLIKPLTSDGNYCKFDILVSTKVPNGSSKLPGC